MGDSIERGAVPANGSFLYRGGLRSTAYAMMTTAGMQPDFRGHLLNADESPAVTDAGIGHGGSNGSSSATWVASLFATWQTAMTGITPHIIRIALGANDGPLAADAANLATLVDTVAAAYPRAALLVGTRTQTFGLPGASGILHRNQVLSDMATRKARGMHVNVVDCWDAFGDYTHRYLGDGLHFTPAGYVILGDLWGRNLIALANGLASA